MRAKTLLRFVTAGSVDDGKSTLIGRLLHDTRTVYEDQLESARSASRNAGQETLDLAYITDGLRAEREQGITIDVAYRYFETGRRKFILADAPGHEQYTRNLATGASTAEAVLILLDARHGVLPQSRRHAYICSLLGIRRAVVAVNKMDLAGFDPGAFDRCRAEFGPLLSELGFEDPQFVPVSALEGDNVVERSARMPWFTGPTVLEYLESMSAPSPSGPGPLRFPVQYVIRGQDGFRGYAGQIASGRVRPGDEVLVFPSRLPVRIASLCSPGGDLSEAAAPCNAVIRVSGDFDIGRGDMLAGPDAPPSVGRRFSAALVWMSAEHLRLDTVYLLKQTTRQVCARVRRVAHRIDVTQGERLEGGDGLQMNDIAEVEIETHTPICFDSYRENRATGSFIVIDMISNCTLGAGMIGRALDAAANGDEAGAAGHAGLTVWFTGLSGAGKSTVCNGVRDRLLARGFKTEVLDGDIVRRHLSKGLGFSREDRDENIRRIGFVANLLTRHGVIVLVAAISPYRAIREEVRAAIGDFVEVYVNAPLEVCEARDPKGLYRKARAGEIPGFTGVDDPYESPETPAVECRTDVESVAESVEKVMQAIDRALG